jgi:hypothetical protein
MATERQRPDRAKLKRDLRHRNEALEPIKTAFRRALWAKIDEYIKRAANPSETVQEIFKDLEEAPALVKEKYAKELGIKKARDIPAWRRQVKIALALDKTRFEDVWGYLWRHTWGYSDCIKFHEQRTIPYYKDKHSYVLWKPNFRDMTYELKIKKAQLYQYLGKFQDLDIVIQVHRLAKGRRIYAVGYFVTYKKDGETQWQRVPFLKNTKEMRQALREFQIG